MLWILCLDCREEGQDLRLALEVTRVEVTEVKTLVSCWDLVPRQEGWTLDQEDWDLAVWVLETGCMENRNRIILVIISRTMDSTRIGRFVNTYLLLTCKDIITLVRMD